MSAFILVSNVVSRLIDVSLSISVRIIHLTSDDVKGKIVIFLIIFVNFWVIYGFIVNF